MDDVIEEHGAVGEKREPSKIVLSRALSFHGWSQSSSDTFFRASRACAQPSSNTFTSCSADSNSSGVTSLWRSRGRCRQHDQSEASELRDMRREPSERHRLHVRPEISLARRDARKRRSGLLRLVVEFGKQQILIRMTRLSSCERGASACRAPNTWPTTLSPMIGHRRRRA